MIETIKCHGCDTRVSYDNPSKGCTNVGHFQAATKWLVVWNTFNSGIITLCPMCASEARQLAARLRAICGTGHVNPASIIGSD